MFLKLSPNIPIYRLMGTELKANDLIKDDKLLVDIFNQHYKNCRENICIKGLSQLVRGSLDDQT